MKYSNIIFLKKIISYSSNLLDIYKIFKGNGIIFNKKSSRYLFFGFKCINLVLLKNFFIINKNYKFIIKNINCLYFFSIIFGLFKYENNIFLKKNKTSFFLKPQKIIYIDKLNKKISFFYLIKKKNLILNIKDIKKNYSFLKNNKLYFKINVFFKKKKKYIDNILNLIKLIKKGNFMQIQISKRILINNFREKDIIKIVIMIIFKKYGKYSFFLKKNNTIIVSNSPETFLIGKNISKVKPIAGTICRGFNLLKDKLFERKMLRNSKEINEHEMLIDLFRNDVNSISKIINNKYFGIKKIEKYRNLQHIVSCIIFNKYNFNKFSIKKIVPSGTLTGSPKKIAIINIKKNEKFERNFYGGIFGYIKNKSYDFSIIIRCLIKLNNKSYIQAASGIVNNSNPEFEWKEIKNKSRSIINNLKI
ncbi:chorismate-binding protein [Candidatus Vidania fulgoroideorum]